MTKMSLSCKFQKIEKPFLEAVKATLDERYTENMESIYKIVIHLIIETLVKGYEKGPWTSILFFSNYIQRIKLITFKSRYSNQLHLDEQSSDEILFLVYFNFTTRVVICKQLLRTPESWKCLLRQNIPNPVHSHFLTLTLTLLRTNCQSQHTKTSAINQHTAIGNGKPSRPNHFCL